MELVKNLGDAFANIALLEEIRMSQESTHQKAYRSLIKRGTCFVPYSISNGIAFAPSRFIGYAGNNFSKHATNEERDGRQTNAALNRIFGHKPLSDETLEQKYQIFCQALGIKTSPKGSFGVERKFWITPDIRDRLDIIAEELVIEDSSLRQTEREQIVKSRIGQGVFRDRLVSHWNGRCCMSSCAILPILRASHIKPWRHSTNKERLDVYNGLLLSPNMDALFD